MLHAQQTMQRKPTWLTFLTNCVRLKRCAWITSEQAFHWFACTCTHPPTKQPTETHTPPQHSHKQGQTLNQSISHQIHSTIMPLSHCFSRVFPPEWPRWPGQSNTYTTLPQPWMWITLCIEEYWNIRPFLNSGAIGIPWCLGSTWCYIYIYLHRYPKPSPFHGTIIPH